VTQASPFRVLCVDDHAVLVEGLRAKIGLDRELEFVGHLPTAEGLVAEARRTHPDVIVLDIEMPGPDPFEAAQAVRQQCPDVRVVFLSAYIKDRFLDAAFQSGAWGYLYKGDDLDSIIAGIRNVARGEFVMGPRIVERSDEPRSRKSLGVRSSKLSTLTPRELHILTMIGRGLSRNEIAKLTHRSVKTIDTHRAAIMDKLDVHDRTELALFAVREGLVET
jgi:NarL family two-component system response regulator LiaR